ncbi:hypothetical protein G7054_g1321 [Neopestalotiopsis clavispora]|nr:hypothetical protein G7054_g1321 [Neopestalotiopsis clavispora]
MSPSEKIKQETLEPVPSEVEATTLEPFVKLSWKDQFIILRKNKRALLSVLGCSTTPVLIGFDLTLVGSIIANESFVQRFGTYDESVGKVVLPATEQLVWTIVQYTSAIASAFLSGYLNDFGGRRVSFFVTVGLTIIGTLVELFSPDWKVWTLAKLLMGAAMGSMQANTQTYVSELAPAEIRGFALSLFQFWIILCSLFAACILQGTSTIDGPWSWKAAVISQFGIAALCVLLFVPFVPESPYYLVGKGKLEEACTSLRKINGSRADFDPAEHVQVIQRTLDHERERNANTEGVSYLECFRGTDRRRTLIACLPIVSQLFMGYPLCGNYLSYFLTQSGLDDAFLITVISTVFALLSSALAFVLAERMGRRMQIMIGVDGMLVCLLVVGILGFIGSGERWNGLTLSVFCICWAVFYYMSVGAVGWTIVGEVSSSRLRAKTTSLAAMSSSIFNMSWSIAIPYLVNAEEANLGAKSGLIFFGFSVVLGLLCFFCIPETKGKTFDELDALFEARVPARKF